MLMLVRSSSKFGNNSFRSTLLILLAVLGVVGMLVKVSNQVPSVHGVAIGMSSQDVERLLGPPHKESGDECKIFVASVVRPIRVKYSTDDRVQLIPNYGGTDGKRTIYLPAGREIIKVGDGRAEVEDTLRAERSELEGEYTVYYVTERLGFYVNFKEGRVVEVTGTQLEAGTNILVSPTIRQTRLATLLGDSELCCGRRYYPRFGCYIEDGEYVDLILLSSQR